MKRFFLFIVNWLLLLSTPLWAGFFILGLIVYDAIKGHVGARAILTGKEFIIS